MLICDRHCFYSIIACFSISYVNLNNLICTVTVPHVVSSYVRNKIFTTKVTQKFLGCQ